MRCIVIESNGTPHIYGTLKEARAELKANGYSYSRANDRYRIAGTEYTARIVRSDSDEYAEAMKDSAEPMEEASVRACIYEELSESETAEEGVKAAADAAFNLLHNGRDPETVEELEQHARMMKAAADIANEDEPAPFIPLLERVDMTAAQAIELCNIKTAENLTFAELADRYSISEQDAAEVFDTYGKYADLPYMVWEDKPETQTAKNYAAENAATSLINAYAEAIGEYPAETDPEYIAAYAVAGEQVAGWHGAAGFTKYAQVANMVQAIADRAPAATKKQAEKQAERYARSADINETRAYDEMQEVFAAIQRGDIESAETAAEWAKTYADRTESDAAEAAKAAQEAGTANAAEWADQANGRIEHARHFANEAAEELAAAKVEGGDITIDKFVTTTADEYGEAFGLIDLKAGTTAYQLKTTAHLYTIGFTEAWDGSGAWVCQIDEMQDGHMGGCEACYTGETPTEALENACVEVCIYPAMRENDNAEDAVNAASYGAYEMLHSRQWPQTAEQYAELDRMMGTAANIVYHSGKAYGIVWEPYRACDEAAENAANALLSAYADTVSTNSAEYRAAHNVAAEEVAGLEAVADMTDRAIVARMVEVIAQRNQL